MAARAQAAPLLLHGERIGKHLSRMVVKRERVDHRDIAIVGDLVQKLLAQLRPDNQQVVHAGQHANRILHALVVAHMGVGEVGEAHAEVVAGRFERTARARRTPHEVGHDVLAAEVSLVDARLLLRLQFPGKVDQIAKLIGREIAKIQDVPSNKVAVHSFVPF